MRGPSVCPLQITRYLMVPVHVLGMFMGIPEEDTLRCYRFVKYGHKFVTQDVGVFVMFYKLTYLVVYLRSNKLNTLYES